MSALVPLLRRSILVDWTADAHDADHKGQVRRGEILAHVANELRQELAVAVCTIGPKLEKQVTDYLSRSEPLRGLLLDGIANAAVDSLTHETCKLIKSVASARDYQVSSPCSPGMPGFPITEQWPLFQLVPA